MNSRFQSPFETAPSAPRRAWGAAWTAGCALGLMSLAAGPAGAQVNSGVPRGTENTGVEQQLGAQLPLSLEFTDQDGQRVALGDSFTDGRPVVLTFNYSDCPQLCGLQLNALVDVLAEADLELGAEIQIVTISIDPEEPVERAKLTQSMYLEALELTGGEAVASEGWTFLVADEEATVRTAAAAAGYGYDLVNGEYSHEAALILCTPDGRVSRYLFGLQYEPQTFRYSMIEASKGSLGTIVERIRLTCFSFDPDAGSYVMQARAVMKLGGLLTVVLLGGFLLLFWRKEILSGLRPAATESASAPSSAVAQSTPSGPADAAAHASTSNRAPADADVNP